MDLAQEDTTSKSVSQSSGELKANRQRPTSVMWKNKWLISH